MYITKGYISKAIDRSIIRSPLPSSLNYYYNLGSILGICLVVQIISGISLAMHYNSSIENAFNSVETIMRSVNLGYLIRYIHSNGASIFIYAVYIHIGRAIYYHSYLKPRDKLFYIGIIIFILMMATAFLGYVLPWGQMSLWGATVITNFFSVIPFLGKDIVIFLWGGFSVGAATLNRFYALHFLLPFLITALVIVHIILLQESGSSNPSGITSNNDKVYIHPYYIFKDIYGFILYFLVLSYLVFYYPNILGHSDNYIYANSLVTPTHIMPESYFLAFYAILRSIDSKLFGVLLMFLAIIILVTLPLSEVNNIRGGTFRFLSRLFSLLFFSNFILLSYLGAMPINIPYISASLFCTIIYFSYFLLRPVIGLIEIILSYYYY